VNKTQVMKVGLRVATEAIDLGRRAATSERRGSKDHHTVIPEATYSPWRTDTGFDQILRRVAPNTLVDHMRLYELWMLAGQVAQLDGDYLEVGVWRGGSAALVATRLRSTGAADRAIVLCDTFTGVALAGEFDPSYEGGEHADTSVEIVTSLFDSCGLPAPEIEVGIFPRDTMHVLEHRTFAFVHIDVDVYDSAIEATRAVWPHVSHGGFVVFDDYGIVTTQGVRRAVDELADSLPGCLRIHNLNGHGILIKR